MSPLITDRLRRRMPDAVADVASKPDHETAVIKAPQLLDVAMFLRDDVELAFDMPIDCTAVDWMGKREPRFDVVYHLYSTTRQHRLRLRIPVTEREPVVPSLTPIWRGFNWHEREAWDMYGIRFAGHPNLKRVLMYEEFKGHPLRKDYPVDGRQPLIEMRNVNQVPTQRQPPADLLNRP